MPIQLTNKTYTDIYGNITNVYKANAGDKITTKLDILSDIYVRSNSSNLMYYDNIDGSLTQSSGDFLLTGFRKGQTLIWKSVDNNNTVVASYTTTILDVSSLKLNLDTTGTVPNSNNNSSQSNTIWLLYVNDVCDFAEIDINFVKNSLPNPSLGSSIDGELTTLIATGLNSLSVGSFITLTQLGKKSGQFSVSNATIKRNADSTNVYVTGRSVRNYEISFDTIFVGILFPNSFIGKDCLKQFVNINFKLTQNESYTPINLKVNDDGNTGFFEVGFSNEIPNIISTSNIFSSCFFNTTNSIVFYLQVSGTTISQIELGGCYITQSDDYNLNKPLSQDVYLCLNKTGLIDYSNVGNTFTSDGTTPYIFTLDSFSHVDSGGNRTFTIGLTFDPQYSINDFGKFIESRGDSDRLFYIWAKAGNTNTLLWGQNLTFLQPVGTLITPITSAIINHFYNSDYSDMTTPTDCDDLNTEDDLGYICDFNVFDADSNKSVNVSIVARNISAGKEFKLEQGTFDLTQKDLNFFTTSYGYVNNNLPNSSSKRISYLMQNSTIGGGLKLRLYYPFILRWETWIKQLNADIQFKALQKDSKNYFDYQITNWILSVKVEIYRNGVVDWFYKDFTEKTYDDSIIVSNISLYEYPTMTPISNLEQGKQILIKATHHLTSSSFNSNVWGEITIEPFQNSPRYVISTEIDTNVDGKNPLYGLTNQKITTTGQGTDTVVFTCLLDMTLLEYDSLSITSKISEELNITHPTFVYTTDVDVLNSNNINLITA